MGRDTTGKTRETTTCNGGLLSQIALGRGLFSGVDTRDRVVPFRRVNARDAALFGYCYACGDEPSPPNRQSPIANRQSPIANRQSTIDLGAHALFEGAGGNGETEVITDKRDPIGAGGIQLPESALRLHNQRCGGSAHYLAIPLGITDMD